MAKLFDSVEFTRPERNRFDLNHGHVTSLKMGELVPVACVPTLPGDIIDVGCEVVVRLAPMLAPVMHPIRMRKEVFFIPFRLVWPKWNDYLANIETLGSLPAFPTININVVTDPVFSSNWTRLMDYMGIPNPIDAGATAGSETISAMSFSAYQLLWNTFYRDQNMQTEIDYLLDDGDNTANIAALCTLRNRAWRHDYFTSALPFAQKGDPVDIPLGNVVLRDNWATTSGNPLPPVFKGEDNLGDGGNVTQDLLTGGNFSGEVGILTAGTTTDAHAYDPRGTLITEATTINDLRRAYALQRFFERNARGGSRSVEQIWAHWGVRNPDARLQRPEFIYSSSSHVGISEVLNTTGTVEAPQGDMAGHGIGTLAGGRGKYFATEHGFVMTLISVIPDTAYQQGIPKHFLKINDPYEHGYPTFAHIGEQEIQNRELYAFQGSAGQSTFGYIPRYAEYKFEQNRVSGAFRTSLNYWHMGRIFDSAPALNAQFIQSDPTKRIFAVEDPEVEDCYCMIKNFFSISRLLPYFGNPI